MCQTPPVALRRPPGWGCLAGVVAAESTRHGGVSEAPYASLNLGLYTDDNQEAVRENRRRFFSELGTSEAEVAGAHQVHGDAILLVEKPGQYQGYDAFITNRPRIFLTATVADCTPVLIFDPQRRIVGAVHAGWKGTTAHIVRKTLLAMMKHFGTNAADCHAYIGTCIDECSYEVDADVADHIAPPFKRWDPSCRKFFIDLKAANRAQLEASGVPAGQISISPYSTVLHNRDYFSHRHEKGRTGRMLALIGLDNG